MRVLAEDKSNRLKMAERKGRMEEIINHPYNHLETRSCVR